MAKSKFEYVKQFESADSCLKNCWIVVRIDGKGFHRFSDFHKFQKPNDERILQLMNRSAKTVMFEISDIVLAFGHSDEYSFVLKKETTLYKRRASKILSIITSQFASAFVFYWPFYYSEVKMLYPPAFDGRVVLYPDNKNLRDYLSWRQADCHVNNLYNTVFWALIHKGRMTSDEAQQRLKGTLSANKHEILFSHYGINYNNEKAIFRKGTTIIKNSTKSKNDFSKDNQEDKFLVLHEDIIGDSFWIEHSGIIK